MAPSAQTEYILHYWPGIPGRGEFIRLAFESTSHPYSEKQEPMKVVMKTTKDLGHPPHFAPPVLEVVTRTGSDGNTKPSSTFLSQTSAILAYLAPILNLDGGASSSSSNDDVQAGPLLAAQINQLTLTILDLNNEIHDVHHPIASASYYEDQKPEAMKRSKDLRSVRIPKFFSLFESTLKSNPNSKEWLISSSFTTADLALFQVVDGLFFAFPRLMNALQSSGKYNLVFELRERIAKLETVKTYLNSSRRRQYGNGVFRHYPELDGEE